MYCLNSDVGVHDVGVTLKSELHLCCKRQYAGLCFDAFTVFELPLGCHGVLLAL